MPNKVLLGQRAFIREIAELKFWLHASTGSHPLWPDEQTIPMLNRTINTIQVITLPLFDLGGGAAEGAAEEGATEEAPAEEEGGAEEGPAEEGGAPVALHPMDCTDIVIAVARGNQYRVIDFYTRDRSTPREDSFYGGEESITGAIAKEEGGMTYVIWRKPLNAGA